MAELVRSKLVKGLLAEVEGILSNPELTPLSNLYYKKAKDLLLSYKSAPKDKKEEVLKTAKDAKELADRITALEESINTPALPAEIVGIYKQAQEALIASDKKQYESKMKEAKAAEKTFQKESRPVSKRVLQLQKRIEEMKEKQPEKEKEIESLEKLLAKLEPTSGRQRIEKDVESFSAFLIPLIKTAQAKMARYPLSDNSDMMSSLRDIQKVVGSISSEKLKSIREIFNSIEKDSYQLTQAKIKEEKKANEDFENGRSLFWKESDNKREEVIAKALELSFAEDSKAAAEDSDEEELEEETGVLGSKRIPAWAEEELKTLDQSVKDRLEEMQVELTKKLYAIREADRQKREELDKRQIELLDQVQEVFTEILLSTPELVDKIQLLQEKIERFPDKLKKRDATPIDIKFINSITTLNFQEEKEKLKLKLKERRVASDKYLSMAERLQKLIAKKSHDETKVQKMFDALRVKGDRRGDEKLLREYDVEDRKENRDRAEDDVDIDYDEDFDNDEPVAFDQDEEFFEPPEEDEDYEESDEEEDEDEVLDSEDEEEDEDEKEDQVGARMKRYINTMPAKVFPLTEGEKILQKIPGIMNLPEKIYKEIQQEISVLSIEIDTIYDIYSQLLAKSVRPLIGALSTFPKFKSDEYLYSLFIRNYSGKPVNWHGVWMSSFSFTDEQRFVATMSTADEKETESLKKRLKEVINNAASQQTIFSKVEGNYITQVLDPLTGNPAEWLERNYNVYLPYIPRIIAKLLVIARTIGSSATRWLGTPEQTLLIDEYAKTRDVLSKTDISELIDLIVAYAEESAISQVKNLVVKMMSSMKLKTSMSIYEVKEMIGKVNEYAEKAQDDQVMDSVMELAKVMEQYISTKGIVNLPEVRDLVEKMTALDMPDKLLNGIPVLPLISQSAYKDMTELVVKLRSLTHTKIEEKTDYPFVMTFEKLAEYIPSLLVNIFIHNRSRISNTRQTYMKKYLLSRLDVEQYIYVKTFMGHPETKGVFSDIIESLRGAHHYASLVERKVTTMEALEKELPGDLFDIVVQAVDHSFYLKVNRIFAKKKTLKEYKESYEKLVPVSKELLKCQFAFLSNCQFAFRERYSLSYPVIGGTVEDLILIDEIVGTLPFDQDGFFEKVSLSKLQEKISGDYQKDLLAAVLYNQLSLLISRKCREVLYNIIRHLTPSDRLSTIKYNPSVDYKDDEKAISDKEVVDILTKLDEKVSGMLKNRNTDFSEVDQVYGKELSQILYVIKKTRESVEIPEEFESYKLAFKPSVPTVIKKSLAKYKKEKRQFSESIKVVDRSAYSISEIESQIKEMNKSSLEDVRKEIGAKNFFPVYYEQFYNIVVHQIKADQERGGQNSLESYLRLYQELISSIPEQFQFKSLPTAAEQDGFFIRNVFPKVEEIKERLSGYMRKVRQFDQFVKQKFLQPKTLFAYKPEDMKMISLHPELMKLLPHLVLYNTTFSIDGDIIRDDVPMEFIRGYFTGKIKDSDKKFQVMKEIGAQPIASKRWVYPSILFIQELMENEIQIDTKLISFAHSSQGGKKQMMVDDEMDVIILRDRVYLLGIERDNRVVEARSADLLDIVHKLELRKVIDVLQSEMVVLPSMIDRSMVVDIASDSIFYPGYTKFLSGKEAGPSIPASTVVDQQLKEMTRLKQVQGDKFVRNNELERLQLKKKLLEGGWKRATIHLIREMERIGVSGLESISVAGIDYKCGLIQNNNLVEVDHDTLLQTIYDFIQTRGPEMRIKKELLKFVEEEEEEDEEEEKNGRYEGTKEKKCLVCDKVIKGKPWFKSVVFDEGKARVVEICSEKCSEMYKPYK